MTDVVEFHMEDRMEKDDMELENSSGNWNIFFIIIYLYFIYHFPFIIFLFFPISLLWRLLIS